MTNALRNAVRRERRLPSKQDILGPGDRPECAHLLLTGFACRYRMLSNERRQITALFVPGDLCDLEAVMAGQAICSVATLSACTLGEIALQEITDPGTADPAVAEALSRSVVRTEAIACEWLVNLGQREGLERAAHLFCELRVRLQAVGLVDEDSYEFPLTQGELGDAIGLTAVHVNRMLQALRRTGFVELKGRRVTILDVAALERLAEFDPAYLQVPSQT